MTHNSADIETLGLALLHGLLERGNLGARRVEGNVRSRPVDVDNVRTGADDHVGVEAVVAGVSNLRKVRR